MVWNYSTPSKSFPHHLPTFCHTFLTSGQVTKAWSTVSGVFPHLGQSTEFKSIPIESLPSKWRCWSLFRHNPQAFVPLMLSFVPPLLLSINSYNFLTLYSLEWSNNHSNLSLRSFTDWNSLTRVVNSSSSPISLPLGALLQFHFHFHLPFIHSPLSAIVVSLSFSSRISLWNSSCNVLLPINHSVYILVPSPSPMFLPNDIEKSNPMLSKSAPVRIMFLQAKLAPKILIVVCTRNNSFSLKNLHYHFSKSPQFASWSPLCLNLL